MINFNFFKKSFFNICKILLMTSVIILSSQSFTKADDISEFTLEGMSIGDSLLDYFSEKEIKKNMMWEYNDNKTNNDFVLVEFYDFESGNQYDGMQIGVKTDDKNYKIFLIAGGIHYDNKNIEDCYFEMNEIDKQLSNIFSSATREKGKKSISTDKSGKSIVTSIYYFFDDGGNASVQCYDFSDEYTKERGSRDNLRVGIRSKEYREWYWASLKDQ